MKQECRFCFSQQSFGNKFITLVNMKRKATPSKQAAKRAKKEKPFEPAAILNNPIGDYLHCDPPVGTSASIVCFGSNVQNKFFTASSTYLKEYTTKTTNNLNSPIQLNFFERGTPNAVRKVYAGYDNSFLLTGLFSNVKKM
jgi:hypothetical protein